MADKGPDVYKKWMCDFLSSYGWEPDTSFNLPSNRLIFCKIEFGKKSTWAFHFENASTFSQRQSSPDYCKSIAEYAQGHHSCDLIATKEVATTMGWRDDLHPPLKKLQSRLPNMGIDTWRSFLNRFAAELITPLKTRCDTVLKTHKIRKIVEQCFSNGQPAIETCISWLRDKQAPQNPLFLITGDAGRGKSLFAWWLTIRLINEFENNRETSPIPLFIYFTPNRPAKIEDLLLYSLKDLGLESKLPISAVDELIRHGVITVILDGFDEISRAATDLAPENIEQLAKRFNTRRIGIGREAPAKMFLTSRPSFLEHEDLWEQLENACSDSPDGQAIKAKQFELQKFSPEQMQRFVIDNSPDSLINTQPLQHWARIQTAFKNNPWLSELCENPLFLRMTSEIFVNVTSVSSENEILAKFCEQEWDRERPKRGEKLTNQEYEASCEVLSKIAFDGGATILGKELNAFLQSWMTEFYPEILAGHSGDIPAFIQNVTSVNPLLSVNQEEKSWQFIHEIFQHYFLARYFFHIIKKGGQYDVFSRPLPDLCLVFLKGLTSALPQTERQKRVVDAIKATDLSGIAILNIANSLAIPLPGNAFEGKLLNDCVFKDGQYSFRGAHLLKVIFEKCDLSQMDFRGAIIKRIQFNSCGCGAQFDENPKLAEDAEIEIVEPSGAKRICSTPEEIKIAFSDFSAQPDLLKRPTLPGNIGFAAVKAVFKALFKANGITYDFPEQHKIMRRLNNFAAQELSIPQNDIKLLSPVWKTLFEALVDHNWISTNPNRNRCFKPSDAKIGEIHQILRGDKTGDFSHELSQIIDATKSSAEKVLFVNNLYRRSQ